MDISKMKETLQEIIQWPRTKSQQHLSDTLNNLDPLVFDEIVNKLLDQISASQVKEYGLEHFAEIDRYPNPHDGFLSRDEITEFLFLSPTPREKAILLWLWLAFDEIRESSDDFDGIEKAFDIVITLKDFQNMKA